MHLMLQLLCVILAIVAVTGHGYGKSHGYHSGDDNYSGSSRSVAAVRSFGGSLSRPNTGWSGPSSGHGANERSYFQNTNDHSTDYLGRSNCGSDNYGFGVHDSSYRSTW